MRITVSSQESMLTFDANFYYVNYLVINEFEEEMVVKLKSICQLLNLNKIYVAFCFSFI